MKNNYKKKRENLKQNPSLFFPTQIALLAFDVSSYHQDGIWISTPVAQYKLFVVFVSAEGKYLSVFP